jgi:NAD(P)-dependent dehydrogenase (short-subunit alcohol dehydrogenase family)
MAADLTDKIALVTGANTGIGKGIALTLASCGASVVVHYNRGAAGAQATVRGIEEMGGHACILQANLESASEGTNLVEQSIEHFGGLDILVNNAAISTECAFFDVTEEIWDRTLNVNLKSAYFCAQAAARHMAEKRYGKIIFIGSVHGELTAPTFGPYAISKGGLNMAVRQLALELAPLNINVNGIAPGLIEVERYHEQLPWYDQKEAAQNVPWGRVGFPKDVANIVSFMASDAADFITGQMIYVDGGQTTKLALHRSDIDNS